MFYIYVWGQALCHLSPSALWPRDKVIYSHRFSLFTSIWEKLKEKQIKADGTVSLSTVLPPSSFLLDSLNIQLKLALKSNSSCFILLNAKNTSNTYFIHHFKSFRIFICKVQGSQYTVGSGQVWRSEDMQSIFSPPCGSQELNFGPQAWQ